MRPTLPRRIFLLVCSLSIFVPTLIHAADTPRPMSEMKSVVWYPFPKNIQHVYDEFVHDLPGIKAAGFNTVWFVNGWVRYEPHALPAPAVYLDSGFAELRSILDLLKANHMHAILGMNYVWPDKGGPEGIDAHSYTSDPVMYKAFEDYVAEVMRRIEPYSDMVYLLVFTEGAEPAELADYKNPPALCAALQATLGSLPTRMPPDLRKKFRIGYHDYSLINLNWGKGCSPIQNPIPFDFLSMVNYGYENYSDARIAQEMDTRAARFRAMYPQTPLIMGESGSRHCGPTFSEANQTRVDKVLVQHAMDMGIGFNLWQFRRFAPEVECLPKDSMGIGEHDGITPSQALTAIKPLLQPPPAARSNATPAAPSALRVVGTGPEAATVTWLTVPSAIGYVLYYGSEPSLEHAEKVTAVSSPYTIHGLSPDRPTYITVTAINANGESERPTPIRAIAEVDKVVVYPNPYHVGRDKGGVWFTGLKENSSIKIFTIAGHFVKTLNVEGTTARWDLTTENGRSVASGLYLYAVPGTKTHGQIAILR